MIPVWFKNIHTDTQDEKSGKTEKMRETKHQSLVVVIYEG